MTQSNHGPIGDDEFFLESWVVIQTDPRDKRSTRVHTTNAAVMPPVASTVSAALAENVDSPAVGRRRLEDLQPRTTTIRKHFSSEQQDHEKDAAPQNESETATAHSQQQQVKPVARKESDGQADTANKNPATEIAGVAARDVISISKAQKKKRAGKKSATRTAAQSSTPKTKPFNAETDSVVLSFPTQQQLKQTGTASKKNSKQAAERENNNSAPASYAEWFKEKFLHSRWTTGFFTFYVHWLLIILLAVLIVHGPDRSGKHSISASMTPPANFETIPFEKLDTRAPENKENTDAAPEQSVVTVADMLETESLTPGDVAIPELAGGAAESAAEGETPGPANFPPVFVPPSAITQGSFTVWTEPEYPEPGHSYRIVIQVRVPEKFHGGYPVLDLEGAVVGSDGYRKLIPGSQTGRLPVIGGFSRISVPIVSADAEVRDIVLVRSKMLRENQKLIIEF